MREESFLAIKAWVKAEAKLIAAQIAGHHPNTLIKHSERAAEAERKARRALEVVD